MDIKGVLLQWFFNLKSTLLADKSASGSGIRIENISNQELAKKLHKPVIKKFQKRKVHSFFIGNIWGTELADMQLMPKLNKEICFLLCVLIFSVNMQGLFLWKSKKVLQLLMLFKNF